MSLFCSDHDADDAYVDDDGYDDDDLCDDDGFDDTAL